MLVDCADPECGEYRCVEPPPSNGWDGPYVASLGATPSDCPTLAPNELFVGASDDIAFAPAECTACTCSPPTGGACSVPTVALYADQICDDGQTLLVATAWDQCELVNENGIDSVRALNDSKATGGMCIPDGGVATLPPIQSNDAGRVCATERGGGCDARICVPKNTPDTTVCITADGNQLCPDGPYGDRRLFVRHQDDRGCDPCECGAPTGQLCDSGSSRFYESNDCTGGFHGGGLDGSCGIVSGVDSILITNQSTPTGGACASRGGTPNGTVAPGEEITLCCLP